MSELLTLEDIARVWHCDYRRARDTIVKMPGFPPKAPGSTRKRPLWHRQRIERFAAGEPESEPNPS